MTELPSPRVSVVNADAGMRDLFRDILETRGFEVATFADALPALDELIASRPDLLVVDLVLDPVREQLSGVQIIHAARTSPELRDVPVVVCSADILGLRDAWGALMERGDIHQLQLPFELRTAYRVFDMALGRPGADNDGMDDATRRVPRQRVPRQGEASR